MAIQDILKKILDEAEIAVNKINTECDDEAVILVEKSISEEKLEVARIESDFDEAISVMEMQTQTMASRENAKLLLVAKQEVIKEAMIKLCDSLENADDEFYSMILEKLFAKFPFKSGKIIVPTTRRNLTEKFVSSNFQIETSDDIKGGFLAYTDGAEVDCSFHSLIFSEFTSELGAYFAEKLKLL